MKKTLTIIVTCLLVFNLMSLVLAEPLRDSTGVYHDEIIEAGGQGDQEPNLIMAGEGVGVKVMAGESLEIEGRQMQIQQGINNQIRLQVGERSADCDCELRQEQIGNRTMLKMVLSNGNNAEIKVMPDVASETALNRLKLKTCSEENECSIELKETGQGNQIKAAYEIKVQRESRFLGLFKTRMQVQGQVDAETGEIIQLKKPWWAFLATEPQEE